MNIQLIPKDEVKKLPLRQKIQYQIVLAMVKILNAIGKIYLTLRGELD